MRLRRQCVAAAGACGLALACAGPDLHSTAPDTFEEHSAPAFTVPGGAENPLLGYAWNGGREIPAFGAQPATTIGWGEPAPTTDTRLLLLMNEGAGGTLHDASPARRTLVHGGRWVGGRNGHALETSGDRNLFEATDSAAWFGSRFSLELRVRAAPAGSAAVLVEEPGSFRLAIDAQRRPYVEVRIGTEAVRLTSTRAIRPGAWSAIGVAADTERFGNLRLVVDGEPRWRVLARHGATPLPLARGSGRLFVGAGASPDSGRFQGAIDELHLRGHALATRTLMENATRVPRVGVQRLNTRSARGSKHYDMWWGTVQQPVLRGQELAQGALDQLVAGPLGLRWAEGQWERVDTERAPAPRTTHPTVYVGAHRAFVFGGEVRDSHAPPMRNTPETWIYDIEQRRWSEIDTPVHPSPRCHQDAAYSPDHGLVLFVGGWRNEGDPASKALLSDVWLFDVDAGRWNERTPRDFRIPKHSDSGVVYHEGVRRFLLFRRSDVYEYDPSADRWQRRPPAAVVDAAGRPTHLSGRVSPIMEYDPDRQQVLRFGGALVHEQERVYTDTTALYDYAANRWTVAPAGGSPSPRVRGALAYDRARRRFVMFGGVRDQFSKRHADLWSFDSEAMRWQPLRAAGGPSERGGYYGMAYDPELDTFALTAGRHSRSVFLDETWHLRFAPERSGSATWVFDRHAYPEASRFFHEPAEPAPALHFRFSASQDLRSFSAWRRSPEALDPSARFVRVEARIAPGSNAVALSALGFRAPAAD